MIEVKSEGVLWNDMENQNKVNIKEERTNGSGEKEERVDGLSPAVGGLSYSAAGLCDSNQGQSEGLCKIETKPAMSSNDIRSPQQTHTELFFNSLNQRTSEKACSYFQQKIPTWRVSKTNRVDIHNKNNGFLKKTVFY